MIKYIIYFFILFIISPAYAEYITKTDNKGFSSKLNMNKPKVQIADYTSQRHPRLNPRCHRHNNYYNPYFSNADLDALEKYTFNRTYHRDSDLARLERLENLAFGAIQSGDLSSRYENIENIILSRPSYRNNNSVLSNIANYFVGQSTGFTPNLIPYPNQSNLGGFTANPYAFTPNYNNTSFENYSNGIFGGGWGIQGNDFGTGSSVRILD